MTQGLMERRHQVTPIIPQLNFSILPDVRGFRGFDMGGDAVAQNVTPIIAHGNFSILQYFRALDVTRDALIAKSSKMERRY